MNLEIFGSESEGYSAHGKNTDELLAACPFCGSHAIEVSNTHTPSYNGSCQDCGAQGPSNDFPEDQATVVLADVRRQHRRGFRQAVQRWNLRGWSAEDKTLAQLTREKEAYTTLLMAKVQKEYPIGARLRIKLTGREVWIDAEVMAHSFMEKTPHDLFVKNVTTGKSRWISCHPRFGSEIELIS